MKTWVVISDLQKPFHDKPIVDLVVEFIKDIRPHGIILNGDVIDCYGLNDSFYRNPMVKSDVLTEQRLVMKFMESLQNIEEKWWLGGNHEDRLRKFIWKHAPLFGRMAELTFPSLFHLGDYGFKWKEYGGQLYLGKLLVTHGSSVSAHSGWTARKHMDKYGTSILVGHTHRLGTFYKRDVRGAHVGVENGCLCRLDPEYDQYPNWQQGFSVVHVAPNGYFNVDNIPIINRESFFYGPELYTRKKK